MPRTKNPNVRQLREVEEEQFVDEDAEEQHVGEETSDSEETISNSGEESEESADETEAMEPMGMYYEPKDYNKPFKLSAKCYIAHVVQDLNSVLRADELKWFLDHEQFHHFFHMPRDKNHKVMGMWMLILRTAAIEKKKQAWFIVNGVPIRYSIEEHALISGLNCLDYPESYENLGNLEFVGKHFKVGSTITYGDIQSKFLSMKKYSSDRLKMAVLYFLTSVMIGQKKSGKQATSVDPFLLRAAADLDMCQTFPWGRLTFDANIKDLNHMLGHFEGDVRGAWVFPSFIMSLELLAFEAIPRLKKHFREDVRSVNPECPRMCKMKFKHGSMKGFPLSELHEKLGTTKKIQSILVPSSREKIFLSRLLSAYEEEDVNDHVVNNWSRFIEKKRRIWLERLYDLDVANRIDKENPVVGNANQEHMVLEDVTTENVTTENVATENVATENLATKNVAMEKAWKECLVKLENEMKKGFTDMNKKLDGINERVKAVESYVDVCRGDFRYDDIIPDVQFGATEVEVEQPIVEVVENEKEETQIETDTEQEKENEGTEIEQVKEKEGTETEQEQEKEGTEIEQVKEKEGTETEQEQEKEGTEIEQEKEGTETEQEKEKEGTETEQEQEKEGNETEQEEEKDIETPNENEKDKEKAHEKEIEKEQVVDKYLKKYTRKRVREERVLAEDEQRTQKVKLIRKGKKGSTVVVRMRSPIVTRQKKAKTDG